MISFVTFLLLFLLISKTKIEPLYLNVFLLLSTLATLVLRVKGIYFNELIDLNYYFFLFFGLISFISFLTDHLKEIQLDEISILNKYFIIFLALEGSIPVMLMALIYFELQRDRLFELRSVKSFLYCTLMLSYFIYPELYQLDKGFFIYLIVATFIIGTFKNTNNMFEKTNITLLALFYVLGLNEYLLTLILPSSLVLLLVSSKYLKIELLKKFPPLVKIFNKVDQYKISIPKESIDIFACEKRYPPKTFKILPIEFVNVDGRYVIMFIYVFVFFSFVLAWGWSL